jgi:hypothetical protein
MLGPAPAVAIVRAALAVSVAHVLAEVMQGA